MKLKTLLLVVLFSLPLIIHAEVDQSIPLYIATTAKSFGIDVQQALYVSWHESHWNCDAVGDHGTSFGCWQIHNPTKKKVRPLTIEQAHDLEISTLWSMQTWLEDKGCFQWSTCQVNGQRVH